jgi:hypothetical protein
MRSLPARLRLEGLAFNVQYCSVIDVFERRKLDKNSFVIDCEYFFTLESRGLSPEAQGPRPENARRPTAGAGGYLRRVRGMLVPGIASSAEAAFVRACWAAKGLVAGSLGRVRLSCTWVQRTLWAI